MTTTTAPVNNPFTVADGCGDHIAELANVRRQQEVLDYAIAAQQKLKSIRGEYADLRSVVYRIRELRPDLTPSRAQTRLVDDLLRQQESVDGLAASLTCLLE